MALLKRHTTQPQFYNSDVDFPHHHETAGSHHLGFSPVQWPCKSMMQHFPPTNVESSICRNPSCVLEENAACISFPCDEGEWLVWVHVQSILSSHWHFRIPSALSLAEQQLQKPEQLDTRQGGSVLGHLQLQFGVPEREQYISVYLYRYLLYCGQTNHIFLCCLDCMHMVCKISQKCLDHLLIWNSGITHCQLCDGGLAAGEGSHTTITKDITKSPS